MPRSQEQYLSDIDEAMTAARSFAEGHDLLPMYPCSLSIARIRIIRVRSGTSSS